MGQEGVSESLRIIHKELDTTLALCGLRDIHDVDTRILRPGSYPLPSRPAPSTPR
ncbi:alpha-hydroxy-acid oxidizing protein [Halomonas marinisediminis]|uniref:alpha-hydroxy-acid oxidizing protein n=1 Tax=Halomonas marinisediminis TaxID=2546095 RepID=UPI0034D60EC8